MSDTSNFSTIRIKKETILKLKKLKSKIPETYDNVINKLINFYRELKHKKENNNKNENTSD